MQKWLVAHFCLQPKLIDVFLHRSIGGAGDSRSIGGLLYPSVRPQIFDHLCCIMNAPEVWFAADYASEILLD